MGQCLPRQQGTRAADMSRRGKVENAVKTDRSIFLRSSSGGASKHAGNGAGSLLPSSHCIWHEERGELRGRLTLEDPPGPVSPAWWPAKKAATVSSCKSESNRERVGKQYWSKDIEHRNVTRTTHVDMQGSSNLQQDDCSKKVQCAEQDETCKLLEENSSKQQKTC
eukprot:654064-Hanusia_phi.AAC.6